MAIVSLMTATSCREAFEQIERDYISAEIRSHQNFGIMTNIQNNSNVVNIKRFVCWSDRKKMASKPRMMEIFIQFL